MVSEKQRRFRYLFRRENREPREQQKDQDMPYVFPAVGSMSSAEIDSEIKLRVKALQANGLLPCTDQRMLVEIKKDIALAKQEEKRAEEIERKKSILIKRSDFKPKFFMKRKD